MNELDPEMNVMVVGSISIGVRRLGMCLVVLEEKPLPAVGNELTVLNGDKSSDVGPLTVETLLCAVVFPQNC